MYRNENIAVANALAVHSLPPNDASNAG